MELNERYSIGYKSLSNNTFDYDFVVDDALFAAYESREVLGGNCDVKVVLSKTDSQLDVDVTIEGSVVCECDRCLEPLTIEVSGDSESDSTFDGSAEENEGVVIDSVEEEILLADYLYQSVLLSLPYSRTHATTDECNPEMLAKFKIVTEEEFERLTASEGSLAESPEAAKLAELKQMLENKE